MKFYKKTAIILSLLAVSGMANAQSDNTPLNSPEINGYLVDSQGHAVRVSDGSCVRTGSYEPGVAYHPECNPKIAQVTPVVPAPQPQPTPVARVSEQTSTKVYFKFDSSVLSEEEKSKIHRFLADTNAKEVKIQAGTDFIGSNAYNQRLSERRANAIAAYVGTHSNIKISSVEGLGKQNANKQNTEECRNVRTNRSELIRCIAEDRSGTVTLIVN